MNVSIIRKTEGENTMKKFPKRLAAIALTAVMCLGPVTAAGKGAVRSTFSENAIVAEAAGRWYPVISEFSAAKVSNYAALPSSASQVKLALSQALGSHITQNGSAYRNYKIAYSNFQNSAATYDKVILLYPSSMESALPTAKLRSWMEKYLQYVNTLKHLTGVSNPYSIVVLNATIDRPNVIAYKNTGSDTWGMQSNLWFLKNLDSATPGLDGFLMDCASDLYSPDEGNIFSQWKTFSKLRQICAVRALKKNGAALPKRYSHCSYSVEAPFGQPVVTPLCKDTALDIMESEVYGDWRSEFLPALSTDDLPDYTFGALRAGMLLQAGGVTVFAPGLQQSTITESFVSNMFTLNDAAWTKMYTLCICNPNNISASFMASAKSQYIAYQNSQVNTLKHYFGPEGTKYDPVTPEISYLVSLNLPYSNGAWQCSREFVRALSAYDFLYPNHRLRRTIFDYAACHDEISSWDFLFYVTHL